MVYGGGDIVLWCKKEWIQWMSHSGHSTQWTQSGCSRIVVYGGGDIVFGAKKSNQWIQWMQSHSGHSTTASTGLTFLPQRQCPHHHISLFHCTATASTASTGLTFLHQRTMSSTTIYHYPTAHCMYCILWFDVFAPKTMSPPPYTTITAYCILHPLRLLV